MCPKQQMGAGIAANPHCPSYRRRRVARRLPLGGSGRGRVNLVPFPGRRPPRLRAESAFRGLAPGHSAWPRSLPSAGGARVRCRPPAVPAGDRSPRAGSVRLQHGGEPFRRRHRLPIKANPDHPPCGLGSKQAPAFSLSASDRSKLRSSAANVEEANLLSARFGFPFGASSSGSACRFHPRGEPRIGPGSDPDRSKLRSRSSAFASAGRFPLRFGRSQSLPPKLQVLPAGFSKSSRASAFAYAGPASSTDPPPAFRPFLLRGKSLPLSAASGRDRFRFRDRFRSVHVLKLS